MPFAIKFSLTFKLAIESWKEQPVFHFYFTLDFIKKMIAVVISSHLAPNPSRILLTLYPLSFYSVSWRSKILWGVSVKSKSYTSYLLTNSGIPSSMSRMAALTEPAIDVPELLSNMIYPGDGTLRITLWVVALARYNTASSLNRFDKNSTCFSTGACVLFCYHGRNQVD